LNESETNRSPTPEPTPAPLDAEPVVEIVGSDELSEAEIGDVGPSVEQPVSTTIGTGSFFGIGCSVIALLFVCVGVAIFMWRQAN